MRQRSGLFHAIISSPLDYFAQLRQKPPSLCLSPRQLTLASWHLSVAASACGSKRCKHAKACLRGEGQDEAGLREPVNRIPCHYSNQPNIPRPLPLWLKKPNG